jgi:hypothetical protein
MESDQAIQYQSNQVNGSTACASLRGQCKRCSSDVAPRRDYAMAISAVQHAVQTQRLRDQAQFAVARDLEH